MRAAFTAPLGALLMIAPLAAIPLLAIIGVPQFAPVVASPLPYDDFEREADTRVELGQADAPGAGGVDLFAPVSAPPAANAGALDSAPRWDGATLSSAPPAEFGLPAATAVASPVDFDRSAPPATAAASGDLDEFDDTEPSDPRGLSALPSGTGRFSFDDDGPPQDALDGWEIVGRPARSQPPASLSRARRGAARELPLHEFPHPTVPPAGAPPGAGDSIALGDEADEFEDLQADEGPSATDFDQFAEEAESVDETAAAQFVAEHESDEFAVDDVPALPPASRTLPSDAPRSTPRTGTLREIPDGPADFRQGLVHPVPGQPGVVPDRLAAVPFATTARGQSNDPARLRDASRPPARTASLPRSASDHAPTPQLGNAEPLPAFASQSSLTWPMAAQRLKQLGIRHYRLESAETEGRFLFSCSLSPRDNPRVTRRFEAEADEPLLAVQKALAEIEAWQSAP